MLFIITLDKKRFQRQILGPQNVDIRTLESPLCIKHSTRQEVDLWAISKVQLTNLTLSEILGANSAAIAWWRALTQSL